ncbi:NIPSNAP protein [Pseudoduganella flava]|uniref:NIPSNAP family protein n=1 Tax=Pseudoduganella flava TaxID=871742 RepID=A0A562Q428_9BURK|nr:NIPSNAP family protein [Pseudoduganella flava]QGZ41512.1 NIPSNAP family protein [Pseudoduganella flava]TWI51483.1 NIPSNAP protein [Pseudoduganella flava]
MTATFPVIELRRYAISPGQRERFGRCFETYFPEAFQQLGALALGQFDAHDDPNGFFWLRGFSSWEQRAVANAAFYYGPVWREHKGLMNDMMTDSDNVLLLRPLTPAHAVPVLPAIDPLGERAQGVLVAQIFTCRRDVAELAALAEPLFQRYRETGARDAGLLVTLDLPNNFPQLPVRTDGPHLVWLGLAPDEGVVDALLPVARQAADQLQQAAELVVLRPTRRSRLRWL